MSVEIREQDSRQESPVLRVQPFGDGKTLVFFRPPEGDTPVSWYLLKENETLVVSSITEETSKWFQSRTGVTLPISDQHTFVYDSRQASLKSIYPQQEPLDIHTLGQFERLHGSTGTPSEEYTPDTARILEQKSQALGRVTKIVQGMMKKKEGVTLGTFDGTTILLIPTTEAIAEASTIAGDPASVDLKESTALVKSDGLLLVKVDTNGDITFGSTSWGKADAGNPNDFSGIGDGTNTVQTALSQVKLPGQQVTRVRNHLIKHLLVNADESYPVERNMPQTTGVDLDRVRETMLGELPRHLKTYIEKQFLPNARDKEEARQLEKRTQVGGLPEDVQETYLALPEDQRVQFLVEYNVLNQLGKDIPVMLRSGGIVSLEGSRKQDFTNAEAEMIRIYSKLLTEWGSLSMEDILTRIEAESDDVRKSQLTRLVTGNQRRDNSKALGRMIARFLAANDFNTLLETAGREYFASHAVTESVLSEHIPDTLPGRSYERAERLIIPRVFYADIIDRQVAMFSAHNPGGARAIYETPFFREVAAKLEQIGQESAASISWMSAESYAEATGRKQFEQFALTVSLATDVARALYRDPHNYALSLGMQPGSEKYDAVIRLGGMIQAALDWNLPEFLPKPTHGGVEAQVPLMLIRPDFARRFGPNGQLEWVATELENSPGGLGMELVIMAGHPEIQSNLVDNVARFMREAAVPEGVNRNRLAIVMTEEWEPYRTELEVFLHTLHEQTGIETQIYSIEELAADPSHQVESGFVFHFAYTWNFMKHPEQYYLNLLLNPSQVAEALGVNVDDVVQSAYRGEANTAALTSAREEVLAFGDKQFKKQLRLPTAHWEKGLLSYIYEPGLLQRASTNPAYAGMTLREIGQAGAQRMTDTAHRLYQRQGADLMIFNDPYMGNCVNGKTDMAIMHLPGFASVLQEALAKKYGFSNQRATDAAQSLTRMTAYTIPLALHTGNEALAQYVASAVETAKANKNGWILKVSADPQFGSVDWGARGLVKGIDLTQEQWEEALKNAAASDIPWVIQEIVENVPYNQPRKDRNAGPIDIAGQQMVGLYNRDPGYPNFTFGELALTPVLGRFNPFLFAYLDRRGREVSLVSDGIITLTPYDDGQVAQAVHGSTAAAMVGVKFKD